MELIIIIAVSLFVFIITITIYWPNSKTNKKNLSKIKSQSDEVGDVILKYKKERFYSYYKHRFIDFIKIVSNSLSYKDIDDMSRSLYSILFIYYGERCSEKYQYWHEHFFKDGNIFNLDVETYNVRNDVRKIWEKNLLDDNISLNNTNIDETIFLLACYFLDTQKINPIHVDTRLYKNEKYGDLYKFTYKDFLIKMFDRVSDEGIENYNTFNYPISEWVDKHTLDPISDTIKWFRWIEAFENDKEIFMLNKSTFIVRDKAHKKIVEFIGKLQKGKLLINVNVGDVECISEKIFIKASVDNYLISQQ